MYVSYIVGCLDIIRNIYSMVIMFPYRYAIQNLHSRLYVEGGQITTISNPQLDLANIVKITYNTSVSPINNIEPNAYKIVNFDRLCTSVPQNSIYSYLAGLPADFPDYRLIKVEQITPGINNKYGFNSIHQQFNFNTPTHKPTSIITTPTQLHKQTASVIDHHKTPATFPQIAPNITGYFTLLASSKRPPTITRNEWINLIMEKLNIDSAEATAYMSSTTKKRQGLEDEEDFIKVQLADVTSMLYSSYLTADKNELDQIVKHINSDTQLLLNNLNSLKNATTE